MPAATRDTGVSRCEPWGKNAKTRRCVNRRVGNPVRFARPEESKIDGMTAGGRTCDPQVECNGDGSPG